MQATSLPRRAAAGLAIAALALTLSVSAASAGGHKHHNTTPGKGDPHSANACHVLHHKHNPASHRCGCDHEKGNHHKGGHKKGHKH